MALTAGSIEIKLFADIARLQSDMNKANKTVDAAMRNIDKSVSLAKRAFGGLAASFGVGQIIKLADEYKRFDAQLKLSTKNLNTYTEAYQNVIRISKIAQSEIGAIGVLYARLNNNLRDFNVTQREVSDVTETISLALRTNNATVQETNSVMLQLSQSFGSGKLNGQEFLAVAEGAPLLLRQLAKSMGVPFGALKDLSAQGKITREELLKAFTDPEYLAALRTQVKEVGTVSSAMTMLTNALKVFIGEQDKATGVTKNIAGAIGFLAENINTLATAGFAVISASIGRYIAGLGAAAVAMKAKSEATKVAMLQEKLSAEQEKINSTNKIALDKLVLQGKVNLAKAKVDEATASVIAAANTNKEAAAVKVLDAATMKLVQVKGALAAANGAVGVTLANNASLTTRLVYDYNLATGATTNLTRATVALTAAKRALGSVLGFFGGWIGVAVTGIILFGDKIYEATKRVIGLTPEMEKLNTQIKINNELNKAGIDTTDPNAQQKLRIKGIEDEIKANEKLVKLYSERSVAGKRQVLPFSDDSLTIAQSASEMAAGGPRGAAIAAAQRIKELKIELDQAKESLNQVATVADKGKEAFDRLAKANLILSVEIAEQKAKIDDARLAYEKKYITLADYNKVVADANKKIADLTGATKALKEEEKDRQKWLKEMVKEQEDFLKAQEKARDDQIEAIDKQNEAVQKEIDKLNENIYTAQYGEEAYRKLEISRLNDAVATAEQTLAQVKLSNASRTAIKYVEDYISALKEQIALKERANELENTEEMWKRAKKIEQDKVEAAKDAAEEIKKANDKMADDLNKALTDSIMRGFESGKSFAKNFRDSLINYFKTLILRPIISFIVDSTGITKVLGAVLGSISGTSAAGTVAGAAGATGTAGTIDTLFSGAKSIYTAITDGFDAANVAFEQSIQKFGTWVTTFGTEGSALTNLGGMISQYSDTIAKALPYAGSVIKLLQGDIKGAATTAIGTAIGSAIGGPIGGAIGGFLGSVAGGLFGGGKKLPRYYTVLPSAYKSGTFQSGKAYTGSDSKGILTGAIDPLTQLSKSFATALGTVLEAFGKDADITMSALLYKKNNTIGRFKATIGGKTYKIDFDGGEDVNETFKKLVKETFTTVFVKALKGQGLGVNINNLFTGLKTQDEVVKMADALVNLANAQTGLKDKFNITIGQTAKLATTMGSTTKETIAYINAMAALGAEVKTVGQSIMDMKQKLIDAFTGAISDANAVIEKFNSAKDSAKFLREKRGVYYKETYTTELPKSIEEYDALLKSINKTTDEGIALFGELLKLRGDFVLFTNAINELKGSVSSSIYSLLSPTEQLAQLQKELADVFASINRTVPTSVDELIALGNSIDYTTEAGLTLASQFPRLVSAFSAVKQAADQMLAETRQIAQQNLDDAKQNFDEAKQNLTAAFDLERQRLQGIIDNVKEAEDKLKTAFDAKKLGIEDTINKFKSFGNSIRDFRKSLGQTIAGQRDPLASSRELFNTTVANALKGDTEALANIESVSSDYLSTLEQYSTDFNSYQKAFAFVSETLLKVENSAFATADVADLQLIELQTQVGKLITLDESVTSVEQAIINLNVAQNAANTAQAQIASLNSQQLSMLGTINGSVMSLATAMSNYAAAQAAVKAAETAAATSTTTDTTTATQVARTSVANMSASQLVAAIKTAGGYSTSSEAIKAVQAANDGHITSAIAKKYLRSTYSTQYYANGGAFTNGIAYDPVAFNTGMMGEAGPEAIMPLTSINGRLGVSTNNSEMVQQLEVISEKISRLESAQIATAQNTGKVARIVERADNGDSLNVTVVT